jgi:phosphatidylglycerol:prolipoprotein diacylglycerol transferase
VTLERRIVYVGLMVASVACAFAVARKTQDKNALSRRDRIALGIGALAGGTFFAKVPFLLAHPAEEIASGHAWLDSGRTLTLGLVGGYFGVEAAKLALGITKKTGDGFVIPVAVGIAIGRAGCFVAGCCYGTPTSLPWGVDFFGDGVHRHPTQLYELVFHASAALFFLWCRARGLFVLQRMKLYIAAYFVFRFVTEWIRPEPRPFLSLTLYQWSAVVFVPVFVVLYLRERSRLPRLAREARQPPNGSVAPAKNARTSS